MEVLEAIKTRRSIRQYKTTPVDEKTLELILEAARWAPSWGNTQCWRFIVVKDSAIKSKIADAMQGGSPDRRNAADAAVRNAPVVIVACAQMENSGCPGGKPVTDKGGYWYMFDVALAMQNLVLAARSLGLGTVYIGRFDAKKVASLLSVPEGFCVVSLTPLGYPDQEPSPRPRKELPEVVFHDKFGNS